KPAMPMGMAPLGEAEIALIGQWIDQIKGPVIANGKATGAKQHPWPYTKLIAPEIPEVKQKEWVKNPIDAFVLAKLEEKGMQPAPLVNKRVLLRRLYFDLIGLP